MKTIVLSGINLFEGGTLSIYKDCLDNIIINKLNKTNNIVAFVHKKELFTDYLDKIKIIELPMSRKNYLFRMWYEYIYFYYYSKRKNIEIWLSIHDITPNVKAKKRYVYCHNPTPFMKADIKNIKYSYKIYLFSRFYKFLYKINIKKNTSVIVQQDWIRREFIKMYKLTNVIVARPTVNINTNIRIHDNKTKESEFKFIYVSFSRFFKNFDVICEACRILKHRGIDKFEVILTVDGSENRYSRDLVKKYGSENNIKFIGLQTRQKVFDLYKQVDCLIFPSKLETWGLPISEFKQTRKPILVSDLPYAHETIGTYDKVSFFDPNSATDLANLMECEVSGKNVYSQQIEKLVEWPYADNWKSLLNIMLD